MMTEFASQRTAIVTGAAKRIGAEIARALSEDGWDILVHYRTSESEARALAERLPGARVVQADLASADGAARVLAGLAGMPPPALLVNSASSFGYDAFDDFTPEGWDEHMASNARGPVLLARAFAAALPAGGGGLIVNLLDAKLSAPNPDFLSYTLSKYALAGLTEIAARALAGRGIRVNAIAPALILPSGEQDAANFARVHDLNPLRRGIEAGDIADAVRFLIASTGMTGQTLAIDGGQRFMALSRDVQFLSPPGDG